jgi:hypothetical protein
MPTDGVAAAVARGPPPGFATTLTLEQQAALINLEQTRKNIGNVGALLNALHNTSSSRTPKRCVRGPAKLEHTNSTNRIPRVYVYDTPASFVNNGHRPECVLSKNCAFGGPAENIHGVESWKSGQFDWPMMVWHQLLHSPMCTDDIAEADLFYLPAFRTHPEIPCPAPQKVWDFIAKVNPKMAGPEAEKFAARHIIVEARAAELCSFYTAGGPSPTIQFKRWNLEISNGIPFAINSYFYTHRGKLPTSGELRHRTRPYAFPYSSIYHGDAANTPAVVRPRGSAEFLWTYLGTNHFRELRRLAETECKLSTRCFYPGKPEKSHLDKTTGQDTQVGQEQIVGDSLKSTFCIEPPGQTLSRKGLVDAIVLGCIPVVACPQQLTLYEGIVSRREFESMVVYIPELSVIGTRANHTHFVHHAHTFKQSVWADANMEMGTYHTECTSEKCKQRLWKLMGETGP